MTSDPQVTSPSADQAADSPSMTTYAAFVAVAALAGSNTVIIRFGALELAPFWAAAVRFLSAGLILLVAVAAMRLVIPRGRALVGVLLYGFFSFSASYMLLYYALTQMTGGAVMVSLALAPLMTLLIASAIGLEKLTATAIGGALLAVVGIGVVFSGSLGVVSPVALVAALLGTLSVALSPIVIKRFPREHPVTANAIGMTSGGVLQLIMSLAVGEPQIIPESPAILLSLPYLIVVGTIGMFMLFLFVLHRMHASAANYLLLIAPVFTVALEAVVFREAIGPTFVIGGLLVFAGVYLGVIRRSAR